MDFESILKNYCSDLMALTRYSFLGKITALPFKHMIPQWRLQPQRHKDQERFSEKVAIRFYSNHTKISLLCHLVTTRPGLTEFKNLELDSLIEFPAMMETFNSVLSSMVAARHMYLLST